MLLRDKLKNTAKQSLWNLEDADNRKIHVLRAQRGLSLWVFKQREEVKAKMGGGMEANKNRFIEDWSTARENLEYNFRWTRRNLALVGFFGIALPIFNYKGIIKEFHMQDEDAGRPYRKFL